jgi:hypothetical protein
MQAALLAQGNDAIGPAPQFFRLGVGRLDFFPPAKAL